MVRDGIYYGAALTSAGVLVSLPDPAVVWPAAVPSGGVLPVLLSRSGARDSQPARWPFRPPTARLSQCVPKAAEHGVSASFLNIFDVHVNRTPIAGTITDVQYHKGRFLVASKEMASSQNEQNTVTVEGNGTRVVFKQIAGLIARRIVFNKKLGDR